MAYGICLHETGAVRGFEQNERLHRECERCGYQWGEAINPPGSSGEEE